MPDYSTFLKYCAYIRSLTKIRGILIYNAAAIRKLTVAGSRRVRINALNALNDNEAIP